MGPLRTCLQSRKGRHTALGGALCWTGCRRDDCKDRRRGWCDRRGRSGPACSHSRDTTGARYGRCTRGYPAAGVTGRSVRHGARGADAARYSSLSARPLGNRGDASRLCTSRRRGSGSCALLYPAHHRHGQGPPERRRPQLSAHRRRGYRRCLWADGGLSREYL